MISQKKKNDVKSKNINKTQWELRKMNKMNKKTMEMKSTTEIIVYIY